MGHDNETSNRYSLSSKNVHVVFSLWLNEFYKKYRP